MRFHRTMKGRRRTDRLRNCGIRRIQNADNAHTGSMRTDGTRMDILIERIILDYLLKYGYTVQCSRT